MHISLANVIDAMSDALDPATVIAEVQKIADDAAAYVKTNATAPNG